MAGLRGSPRPPIYRGEREQADRTGRGTKEKAGRRNAERREEVKEDENREGGEGDENMWPLCMLAGILVWRLWRM